jgi:Undecaprenyl-phosphate glucose phosphotransferase
MSEVIADFTNKPNLESITTPKIAIDLVMLLECFMVLLGAVLAQYLYLWGYLGHNESFEKYFYQAIAAAGLICHTLLRRGLYTPKALLSPMRSFYPVLSAVAMTFVLLVLVGYVFKYAQLYSRGWMLSWFGLTVILLISGRLIVWRVFLWFAANGYFLRRVAVFGPAKRAAELVAALKEKEPNIKLTGVFEFDGEGTESEKRRRKAISKLIALGQKNQLDEIFIVSDALDHNEKLTKTIAELRVLPLPIKVCPVSLGRGIMVRECESVSGYIALAVQGRPISAWDSVQKMMLDYIVGGLALILLAPLFALIAIAIKWDTPGPVFFRQRRHGFNHSVIRIWKFRTMTVTEDGDSVVQAKRDDARVTRVGRFLRSTSFDELPQLINVLAGDMSLVGPRPHALVHNELYSDMLESYGHRHLVKPGITGWAQINGLRGPTDANLMRKRVDYDRFYIENWSLMFDIRILFATPIFGFVGRNAF